MAGLTRMALCEFSPLNSVAHTFRRMVTYRQNCRFMDKPKCTTNKQPACYLDKQKMKILPNHPLEHIWYKPECCNEPCKDAPTRFDDLYYFISDKAKRKYTRTWNECPKVVRCKRVCCYDGKERSPPFIKRPKNVVIDTACPATPNCLAVIGKSFLTIKSPGCQALHKGDVYCRKRYVRAVCKKFCTPYPSFSECLKDTPDPSRPNQCDCLSIPAICDYIGKQAPVRQQRCN